MKNLPQKMQAVSLAMSLLTLSAASQAQMWTDLPAQDPKAQVITQRADSPIYSRMASDKKFREFAQYAINIRGEQLNYELVLESRAALFKNDRLRKVYESRAGKFYVSYWIEEGPNYRTMPFKRNAYRALIVVDTVPNDANNPQFKAVAEKLPYVTYRIIWEQFNSNSGSIRADDTGSAVKWDCKTKDGKAMPTMLQPITIYKPNFKEEKEWYSTAYYITDDGSLKSNGSGKQNICAKRSVGPDDEVSKWVRFFGGV